MMKKNKNSSKRTSRQQQSFFLASLAASSCVFVWESMLDDISMVFAYYKEGATDPTFCTLVWG
ncbi:hypothetical protein Hanom_Chr00s000234g01630031 [Helianthus anomalus]